MQEVFLPVGHGLTALYAVRAVICKSGAPAEEGHYVCVARQNVAASITDDAALDDRSVSGLSARWWLCDDSNVKPLPRATALQLSSEAVFIEFHPCVLCFEAV